MAIKPIHEAIKLSERTDSTIGEVIPRWHKAKSELSSLIPFIPELQSFLQTTFPIRLHTQIRPVHGVAHYLLPAYRAEFCDDTTSNSIIEWLWKQCNTQEEKAQLHKSFWAFKHQKDEFHATSACWIQVDDPHAFWISFLGSNIYRKLADITL